jgi:hypothetical protein
VDFWAYFNKNDGNAYFYYEGTWYILAKGGTTIKWQGELASAPANPQLNWAYYNSEDGKSYIYDGTAWQVLAQDGAVGPAGPQGPSGAGGSFVPITSVSLSESTLSIVLGRKHIFTASVLPATATIKDVFWTSNNDQIVSVDTGGRITTKTPGRTIITAASTAASDGIKKAESTVTVTLPVWTAIQAGTGTGQSTFPADTGIRGIAWDGPVGQEKFVAVGSSGRMARSADGVTWTAISAGTNVGQSGFPTDTGIRGIAWGGPVGQEKFVAVGDRGRMAYSPDGITWTGITNSDSTFGTSYNTINRITWGGSAGNFVAVGQDGKMAYSPDGVNWTAIPPGTGGNPFPASTNGTIDSIVWGGPVGQEKFIAVGRSDGRMAHSTNGITWTAVQDNTNMVNDSLYSITWGGPVGQEKFIAGGTKIVYSPDGITWTAVANNPFTGWIESIVWGGPIINLFVAVGGNTGGIGSARSEIAYSADGIVWVAAPTTAFDTTIIFSIAWGGLAGQEKFVAIGTSGKMAYTTF